MRIIFFGTPDYVVPVLDIIHKKFRSKKGNSPFVAVVTQEPKPSGRDRFIKYSAVDTWAYKRNIPKLFDPLKVLDYDADLGILASYGAIIPKSVIEHFPNGILNIHPSLLPKYRGASPVQASLIAGDTETGSTIMLLDEKLDHGPIISQFKDDVLPEDTTGILRERLFERSAEVLSTLIPAYIQGKITPHEQNHAKATFTRELKKEDAFIPPEILWSVVSGQWSEKKYKLDIGFVKNLTVHATPDTIHRFIRAMQPWPIAWSKIRINTQESRIKLLKAHLNSSTINHQPLIIDSVQLEGKNPVSWKQLLEGYPKATF